MRFINKKLSCFCETVNAVVLLFRNCSKRCVVVVSLVRTYTYNKESLAHRYYVLTKTTIVRSHTKKKGKTQRKQHTFIEANIGFYYCMVRNIINYVQIHSYTPFCRVVRFFFSFSSIRLIF